MRLSERILQWRRKRLIKAFIAEGLSVPSSGKLKNPAFPRLFRGDYSLKNSELIFSAVLRLSNTLASMPIQLYRNSTPVRNDLNDLMSVMPNPNMTSTQFMRAMEACRCTAGNCYALKIYDHNGNLSRIDLLDPCKVKEVIEQDSGELWYRITPEFGKDVHDIYVHNYYVVHVPFISTNGYIGVNPVSVLYDTLEYNANIQEFSKNQLEKGVNAAIVLEAPASLGEAQRNKMVEDFMTTYRETSGNILLLESGVVAKSMNLSPVDSKLFEVERISRSRVAMVYNMPPHLMGDFSETSFNSQEQQMLEFLMTTMLPTVTAYEQEFNRALLTREDRKRGYHWEIDMDAILRADAATRAEVDYKAVRSGWSTPDEIRASRGYPALPNGIGKHALVSQDLAPLSYTVKDKPRVLAAALNKPEATEPKEDNTDGNNDGTDTTSQ